MPDLADIYSLYRKCTKVDTDSRSIAAGSLFVALRGVNFDGNRFAHEALKKGSRYALVDDAEIHIPGKTVLVQDTLKVLQGLARYHRDRFSWPVLAITGSNGKTTTKELISRALSTKFQVHATLGNLNNHIGVPLTLLNSPVDSSFSIVEMGANHQGEIWQLCEIANPTHALITNIGRAHLEGFGSIEGVLKAKTELYKYVMGEDGWIFVNTDEDYLESQVSGHPRVYRYFRTDGQPVCDGRQSSVNPREVIPRIECTFRDSNGRIHSVKSQLFGNHNFQNVKSAIAVANFFNVNGRDIEKAIGEYRPANNRSEIVMLGSTQVIMDAYNANPSSVRAAMDSAVQIGGSNTVVILGDMLELGSEASASHRELVDYAFKLGVEDLILVGEIFGEFGEDYRHFSNVGELKSWLSGHPGLFEGKTVLLKGSRKMQLERVFSD